MSVSISVELLQEAQELGYDVSVRRTFLHFSTKANSSSDKHSRQPDLDREMDLNRDIIKHSTDHSTRDALSAEMDGEQCSLSSCSEAGSIMESALSHTTVMIRNIPNKLSQDCIMSTLKHLGFHFNFFYCPIDHRHKGNLGYFFVNLLTPAIAVSFIKAIDGRKWPDTLTHKRCAASWARTQGYKENVQYYQKSPLMKADNIYSPRIFNEDGTKIVAPMSPKPIEGPFAKRCANRKVFVGGLPTVITEPVIRNHLEQFGEIEEVSIIYDSFSRLSRGFCFVTFVESESVRRCVAKKEAHFLEGKPLGIRPYVM